MKVCIEKQMIDYETYKELRASVGWENFCRQQAEEALSKSAVAQVAKVDGKTVGMARAVGDSMFYIIVDVVVRPEYQHFGIGTQLVKGLLSWIEEGMLPGSRVSVQLLAEKGKEGFYEKMGFKLVPHEFCGPALRKVMYKK
ncbi:MAG: GNAT family N-acetyltransferase [Lachnospiraceae bacterium]|jgi:GNAT superfamily N-acetyltransferase|nr:GNAT family N-acetyltransferase [Lachnospiraceae bacterium]